MFNHTRFHFTNEHAMGGYFGSVNIDSKGGNAGCINELLWFIHQVRDKQGNNSTRVKTDGGHNGGRGNVPGCNQVHLYICLVFYGGALKERESLKMKLLLRILTNSRLKYLAGCFCQLLKDQE
jgi:hypothetical protein